MSVLPLPSDLGLHDERTRCLAEALAEIEPDAFLVGGAVRDALLGASSRLELDLAVKGDGLTIAGRLADMFVRAVTLVPLDPKRGAVRIALKGNPPGSLDICSFKGKNLEADLRARDFTMNAVALCLRDALRGVVETIDVLGGVKDIDQTLIRACSPDSFADDPLRILRAFRFRAVLGFDITPDTLRMMVAAAPMLTRVSAERVRDELAIILSSAVASRTLGEMDQCRVLDLVFPELAPLKGVEQNSHHHLDVFLHTLEAVRQLESLMKDPAVFQDYAAEVRRYTDVPLTSGRPQRWLLHVAALLHDTGKPATKFTDQDGRIRFFGHERISAVLAEAACKRLKLSIKETRVVVRLVENHMRPMALCRPPVSRRTIFRLYRDLGNDLAGLLLLFLADIEASQGPARSAQSMEDARQGVLQAAAFRRAESTPGPPPLLTGKDIIDECGVSPGPLVGVLLALVEEARGVGEITTRAHALDLVAARLARKEEDPTHGKR